MRFYLADCPRINTRLKLPRFFVSFCFVFLSFNNNMKKNQCKQMSGYNTSIPQCADWRGGLDDPLYVARKQV